MSRYVALVVRNERGSWFCHVPDIPGFTAGADSLEELLRVAPEILVSHVAALVEAGAAVPEARDYDSVRNDPALAEDFAEAVLVTALPLLPYGGRAVRVNVSLDAATLQAIDETAARLKLSRSAFLAEAARRMIAAG